MTSTTHSPSTHLPPTHHPPSTYHHPGACSVSIIHGELTADRAKAMSGRRNTPYEAGQKYSAAAISLVFHSSSPLVPTFRADGESGLKYQPPNPLKSATCSPSPIIIHKILPNATRRLRSVRFFEISGDGGWFGGGADLTPYYLVDSDCAAFHRHYKTICDGYSESMGYKEEGSLYGDLKVSECRYCSHSNFYEYIHNPLHPPSLNAFRGSISHQLFHPTTCQARCDEYFQLPARGECRGVGGIFFDDLTGIAEDGAGEGAGFTGAWTEESLDLAQGFTEVSCGAEHYFFYKTTHDRLAVTTEHYRALLSTIQ